jgi:cytochrome oxidase Cu insertion factor (SCO1/SenC/PrrC family)
MRWVVRRPAAAAVGLAGMLLGVAALQALSAAQGGNVKEGQPAPAVELPATQIGTVLPDKKDAKTLKLQDLKGKKNVVLFFFPKAMTKG